MMDYDIRNATYAERKQIFELVRTLCEDLDEKLAVTLDEFSINFEQMLSRPESYVLLVTVAQLSGQTNSVLGYLSMVCYRTSLNATGTALINELVVHRDHRNCGIGAALVSRAREIAESRHLDEFEVGALRTNIDAIRFYKRNGFDQQYVLLGREL